MINNKHFLSSAALILFLFLAVASSSNQLLTGALNRNNSVESKDEDDIYLVKNDGTRVYGKKLDYQYGMLVKNLIKIDDKNFKFSDIRGYRDGKNYFTRLNNSNFIQRIVRGKINVYVHYYTDDSYGRRTTRTDYYSQTGEMGTLKEFDNPKEIKELVADCPLSVQMIEDMKSVRKAVKSDENYLNRVFETYNNNCKPVKSQFKNL